MEVKKVIIPMAGLGTRFLPLSKVVPKELWPLNDGPVISKIINEIKESGVEKIVFILNPKNKAILDYLKPSPKIIKLLKERKRDGLLEELEDFEKLNKKISFSYVFQKNPLGDGHAILQASKMMTLLILLSHA